MMSRMSRGAGLEGEYVADKTNGYREAEGLLAERRLDRARFLRLIGAGATLPFVPASLAAFGARSSSAQTTQPPTPAELVANGEFPIGVWTPPPPKYTTAERYQQISNAGFNFVIGGNGVTGNDDHPRTLAAAEAAGLRFLLTDNILQNAVDGEVSPERQEAVTKRVENLLKDYGSFTAVAGFNLFDEPHKSLFNILEYAKNEVISQSTGTLLPYVNIWPSYAAESELGTQTYREYLDLYRDRVNPPVLSFDHYPLLSKRITDDYFFNWAVIRQLSQQAPEIPSWGFIQSVGFDGRKVGLALRRTPDKNEIFWQINVSLAYGAKGIQYFTYWTPSDPDTRFGNALITRDGKRTLRYQYAAEANEYLRVVGEELLPLKSESVVHAGEKNLPRGAEAFSADDYVRMVNGSPVILSRFSNPDVGTDQYLFVANRSYVNTAQTRLTLSDSVTEVFKLDTETNLDPDTGSFDPVTLQGTPPRNLLLKIGPGRAHLYLLRTA
jgi:hypothetical protein